MAHKEMKAELTCPICMELFKQPRRLPCGHAYCHTCIATLLQVRAQQEWTISRRLVCPECRDEMRVDFLLGIEALPVDFKLSRLVELMRSMEPNSSNSDDTESASPVREFPESRPDASSPTASSSASTPPIPLASASVAPNSEVLDLVRPNSSSSSPSPSTPPRPRGQPLWSNYDIPFPEVDDGTYYDRDNLPFPGLPRTEYDDYLDTLTYPELWNEASVALNSLLESYQSHHDSLGDTGSSLSGSRSPDHQPSSSPSSSSSSLDRLSSHRRFSTSSSSSTSSNGERPNQPWSLSASSNADTTTNPSAADTATANDSVIAADSANNVVPETESRPIDINNRGAPSTHGRGDCLNDSNSQSNPVTENAFSSLISNDDAVVFIGRELRQNHHSDAMTTPAVSSAIVNSRDDSQNNLNNNDFTGSGNDVYDIRNSQSHDNHEGYNIGNGSPVVIFPFSPLHRQRETDETESSNAHAFREFLRFRNRLPRMDSSFNMSDNGNAHSGRDDWRSGHLDAASFERSEEKCEGENKKGKDNFKIKYLKLKKRVVNIFKDSYSTTESSDEEIEQERERLRERERKREAEEREKEDLKAHRKKLTREGRKWRMTRNLIALILSDDSTSSDSDSNTNQRENHERRGKAVDKKHDEAMNENMAGNERPHHGGSDSNNNDSNGRSRPFTSGRQRRKIAYNGVKVRDGGDDNADDDAFRRSGNNDVATGDSRPSPHNDTSPLSPLHRSYPVPTIPPLQSVYDNTGIETANLSQAPSHQSTATPNARTPATTDPSNQQWDRNLTLIPVSSFPGSHVLGDQGIIARTVTETPITSSSSRDGRHSNTIPRHRLASETEGGGTFYDNVCELEIVRAVNNFVLGRVDNADVNDRNDDGPAHVSTQPEIEELKTSVDEERRDETFLGPRFSEIFYGEMGNAVASAMYRELSQMASGEGGATRKDYVAGRNDGCDDDCEIESLKVGRQNASSSSETVQKKYLDGNQYGKGHGQSGCTSATEVKLAKSAKPQPEGAKVKLGAKQKPEGAKMCMTNGVCIPPLSALSLYDNVEETRTRERGNYRNVQAIGGRSDGETRFGKSGVTGGEKREVGRRKDLNTRVKAKEGNRNSSAEDSSSQLGDGSELVSGEDSQQNSVHCDRVPVVVSSVDSVTPATVTSESVISPQPLSAAATGGDIKPSVVMEIRSEGNSSLKISNGDEGNHCVSGGVKRNNNARKDSDDDESDIESAAPHSAMLKIRSSGGVEGRKPKSRFRKFISSLMWVSSSSSSDENDYDDSHCGDNSSRF